jgi:hypothetical protein
MKDVIRLDDPLLAQGIAKLQAIRGMPDAAMAEPVLEYGSGQANTELIEASSQASRVETQLAALIDAAIAALGGTQAALHATDSIAAAKSRGIGQG